MIWNAEVVPRLIREFVESPAVTNLQELLEAHQSTNAVMAERCATLRSDLPKLARARHVAAEALRLADIFRASVVDSTLESFVFEITGTPEKIDAFADLMRPLGLIEIARTGVAGITRGPEGMKD